MFCLAWATRRATTTTSVATCVLPQPVSCSQPGWLGKTGAVRGVTAVPSRLPQTQPPWRLVTYLRPPLVRSQAEECCWRGGPQLLARNAEPEARAHATDRRRPPAFVSSQLTRCAPLSRQAHRGLVPGRHYCSCPGSARRQRAGGRLSGGPLRRRLALPRVAAGQPRGSWEGGHHRDAGLAAEAASHRCGGRHRPDAGHPDIRLCQLPWPG